MASLKEVKNRISSVKSTRKITSAMKMVASAKLHRAQNAIENMLPYQKKMNRILTDFLSSMDETLDTSFTVQREVKRVGILVFSSNSSLCGAFNANVIRRFTEVSDNYQHLSKENILVYPVGRKIEEAVKKMGFIPQGSFQELAEKPSYDQAAKIAGTLMELFVSGELDKVEIIFHHFKSAGAQELLNNVYLPIDLSAIEEEAQAGNQEESNTNKRGKRRIDYIVEPSVEEFIASLLPTVLKLRVYTALLDSNASEHAARMMAMQVATDNANELIQDLTKQYNKTRQQTITNELLDIIGGSMN